ncbi:putative 50S ribosomal protein L18 [Nannochloris sp. 'desiccata']|nr:putative 50S ribosomal protein L18 [Chlorella desiccata (nom. nud.)]
MASVAQAGLKELQLKLFISNKYAYAQIVRASDGNILAAASTIEKGARDGLIGSAVDKSACSRVGELLAERAVGAGIDRVSWQRKQGQRYHGRVASLITSMQNSGLKLV